MNTCGFLDSAKLESLDAIGEALRENGRVIVTGCLGADPEYITGAHPTVLAVTGPHQYEQVLDAVHAAVPPAPDPFIDLLPATGVSLTPRHYSYLKIAEGCDHKCKFCIIPDMRGRLQSRPAKAVLREAEKLVEAGVRELLVISQDTSAYGTDWKGREVKFPILDLSRDLSTLGAWVRLHYVYPYPHVRDLIPLMADPANGLLPYLDIPFQHAHPDVLARMARPAAASRTLEEIAAWRRDCPDITLRSTFIVGYPGETEAEFQTLLDWLDEAQLDRVGCFQYENVAGARSNALPDHVPEEVKQDRWDRFMAKAQAISEAKLAAKVGRTLTVLVDSVDEEGATCRTMADAPEIDGNLFIDEGFEGWRRAIWSRSRWKRPATTTCGGVGWTDRSDGAERRQHLSKVAELGQACGTIGCASVLGRHPVVAPSRPNRSRGNAGRASPSPDDRSPHRPARAACRRRSSAPW